MRSAEALFPLFGLNGLSRTELTTLAFETGFCQRDSGIIGIPEFFHIYSQQSLEGTVSYNDLAAKMEAVTGVSVSRQGYHHRMGVECADFFQRVLERIIAWKHPAPLADVMTGKFTRMLVQDSTILRLPQRLFPEYSGVKNGSQSVCNARIQSVYDLISRQFVAISLDPYTKNDLAVTSDIQVEPGDLVIRDRGYFTLEVMTTLKEKGADSLFLYKHGTKLYDPENGKEINLLAYLRQYGSIDKVVLAGSQKQYSVRIVAQRVDEETANLRRMRAKKKSSHKNPSPELLALMSWTIFLTTIFEAEIIFDHLYKLYGLRWRIENIFKTWKSNLGFSKIHNVSQHQFRVLLLARLSMNILLYHHVFNPLSEKIYKLTGRFLSLMKVMRYIQKNMSALAILFNSNHITERTISALLRFCQYDRRKRDNYELLMRKALEFRCDGFY